MQEVQFQPLVCKLRSHMPRVLPLVTQSCQTLCNTVDWSPPSFSVRGDSPGKNTGAGCHALFQGIFPNQGSNSGLLHSADSLPPQPLGKWRILKWVAHPSSRGSFQYRDESQVSQVAGEFFFFFFFNIWATRKSPRILQWVAYPFSRGSSPPRNGIGISCIAGGFFTSWAIVAGHKKREKK